MYINDSLNVDAATSYDITDTKSRMLAGDSFNISLSVTTQFDSSSVKPSLQCTCSSSVRSFTSRHKNAVPEW
ncbi:hypothetical protein Tco_0117487 [Tanacetum coccineum]